MSNALIDETSPYLLQHAENPVDWYPWNEAALKRARELDRPILLSIGYSACHWCHVMAHESFADDETAAVLNRHFVNIKVDREERPDLDRIYQTAHQLLTGRGGGWPLTVFLEPGDLTPFFAGTYFPREARHGLPPFIAVLQHVAKAFADQRPAIGRQNAALRAALSDIEQGTAVGDVTGEDVLEQAMSASLRQYDAQNGGRSGAPKFPQPRLIRLWMKLARRGRPAAGEMAERTLLKMAEGGLFDHLAGGFFRYCVDADWTIPHFEKMLYDNAELLAAYAEAWAQFKNPFFADIAWRTAEWLLAEMQLEDGGFAASFDADTGGVEGASYLWRRDEIDNAIGAALESASGVHRELYKKVYGLDRPPNFEGRLWHLKQYRRPHEVASELGLDEQEAERILAALRAELYAARRARPSPARDNKLLTSWNALTIAALADAGRLLNEPQWSQQAAKALDFVLEHLMAGGRLGAVYAAGQSRMTGLLDDHAFLLAAVSACLRHEYRAEWAAAARHIVAQMSERFAAPDGGFYLTPSDHESLPARPEPWFDEATPAGNALVAAVLLEFAHVFGDASLQEAGGKALQAGLKRCAAMPLAAPTLLAALVDAQDPPPVVLLHGQASEVRRWCRELGAILDARVYPRTDLPVSGRHAAEGVEALLCTADRCETWSGGLTELTARLKTRRPTGLASGTAI